MKLELKHITKYLPYRLKGINANNNQPIDLIGSLEKEIIFTSSVICDINRYINPEWIKPILRPISSMTSKEAYQLGVLITHEREMDDKTVGVGKMTIGEWQVPIIKYTDIDGEEYSFMVMFCEHGISATNDNNLTFEAYEWLYENHFDIYGLIDKGLAININKT